MLDCAYNPHMHFVLVSLLVTASGDYTIDAARSELVIKTKKEGIGAMFAHNHVIAATELTGQIHYDPSDLSTASVSITVKTASLLVDDAAMRKRHGEPKPVPASDQKKIIEEMKAEGQLDTAKFATVAFASTSFARDPKGALSVTGKFSLHGITKTITLPVNVTADESNVTGDGVLRFKTSDYGITPYSGVLGTVRNSDEVELVMHLTGTR